MYKLPCCLLLLAVGCAQAPRPTSSDPRAAAPRPNAVDDLKVTLSAPEYSRQEDLAIQVQLQGQDIARVTGLELWKTADGGTSWQLALSAPASEPLVRCNLPEGTWGLRAVAILDGGARTSSPTRGDTPDRMVTVDRTPPQIVLGEPEVVRAGGSPFPDVENFDVRVPYTIADGNPSPTGAAAAISFDAQSMWRTVARPSQPSGIIAFTVTGFYSPLLFRLRVQDLAGNAAQAEKEAWPEDIAAPPDVHISSPVKGALLKGGSRCVITYRVQWDNAAEAPIALTFSPDGKVWQALLADAPNTGTHTWQVPLLDCAAVYLRLEAKGRTGRRILRECGPFTIDSTAPGALILGPDVLPSPQGEIHVDAFDRGEAPSGVAAVTLFARPEGEKELHEIGRNAGNERKIPVQLAGAGKYEVWAVVTDRAGNESAPAAVGTPFALRVSREGAALRFLSFADGGVLRAGSTHFVAWNLAERSIPANAATLYLIEGSREIALANVDPLAGKVRVDFPLRPLAQAALRLDVALADGSMLRATSGQVSSDGDPPRASITKTAVEGSKVTLAYAIEDRGPAGLKSATLYVSDAYGRAWRSVTALQEAGEVTVDLEAGFRGLYILAEDNVGNRAPEPGPDAEPQAVILVGTAPDDLLSVEHIEAGTRVRGGTTHYIAWRCRLNETFLRPRPARMSWSVDDRTTFKELGRELPASGEIAVHYPNEHGARVHIKVDVDTVCDRALSATAGPIAVDSRAPGPFVAGPATSAKTDVILRIQSPDDPPDTLTDVRVYARRVATAAWKQLPHTPVADGLQVALSDGQWEVFVAATDRVGNRTPSPGKETPGHVILVDTVPPVLVGRRDPDAPSVNAGSLVRYTFDVRDANPAPVSLSVAGMNPGESWKQRETPLPVDLPLDITLPEKEGVYQALFTVQDIAGNKGTWTDMINVVIPAPELAVTMPEGTYFPGGSRIAVAWSAKNAGAGAALTIALSLDGGESQPVAENLGSKGKTEVALPQVDTRAAVLSFSLQTKAGRTTVVKSAAFTISAHKPEATIMGNVLRQ